MTRGFGQRMVVTVCALVVWLATGSIAEACFCGGLAGPCRYLWGLDGQTPVVFEGTVESIERRAVSEMPGPDGGPGGAYFMNEVRFKDVRHLLGERATIVLTGTGGGDCGYELFAVGQRFVVHATPDEHGLTTSTCSFTAPVAKAGEVLDYIASLSQPSPGARIAGKAVMARRNFVGLPSVVSSPLAGVRVTLEGLEQRSTVTDADGAYRFEALKPGRYQVSLATDHKELTSFRRHEDVVLVNAHACAMPYAEFYVDGTVEGEVVDPEGRPIARAAVSLRAADIAGQDQVSYDSTWTDAAGHFRFGTLAEGRYVVGVNLASGPRDDSPYAITFAAGLGGAPAIIELARGGHLGLPPIVARLPTLTPVTGRVVLPDGKPLAGVVVRAFAAGEGHRSFGATVEATTDADGRFRFSLGQQQPYGFSVYIDQGNATVNTVVRPGLDVQLTLRPRR